MEAVDHNSDTPDLCVCGGTGAHNGARRFKASPGGPSQTNCDYALISVHILVAA
jgi:hypothetical protein